MKVEIRVIAPREAINCDNQIEVIETVAKNLTQGLLLNGITSSLKEAYIIDDEANTNDTVLLAFHFEGKQ